MIPLKYQQTIVSHGFIGRAQWIWSIDGMACEAWRLFLAAGTYAEPCMVSSHHFDQCLSKDSPSYFQKEGLFFVLSFFRCWLLGFLASWLLGFSACCWFMRLLVAFWLWLFASSAFPVPFRQVAFWLLRLCGFWWLWLFASSAFTVPLWAFWLLHPFIGFWIWLPASSALPARPYLNHHFFDPLLFRLFAE